jgi:hypothetical protein
MLNWDVVRDAYDMVDSGAAKRIDGDGFVAYKVGEIIRIDIKDLSQ